MNDKTRILICDDETHILHVVGLNLRSAGYEPVLAANGEQALEAVAQSPPALCVIDHQMPGMTGSELCRRLRAFPGLEATPIVMLTAADFRMPRPGDGDEQLSAVVGKPFSPKALIELIQSLLAPSRIGEDQ
ncbi:MAG: response regulator [Planctomycetota bacterium]